MVWNQIYNTSEMCLYPWKGQRALLFNKKVISFRTKFLAKAESLKCQNKSKGNILSQLIMLAVKVLIKLILKHIV